MGFDSIDEYINNLDGSGKRYVDEFVLFLKTEFPKVMPKISYAMPMWWAGAKMYDGYVAISPAKKHCSVHFYDESYLLKLKEELPNCSFGKRCININYGDEQSFSVVKRYVRDYFNSIL